MVLYALPKPGVLKKRVVQYVLMMNVAITDILLITIHGTPTVGVFLANKWPFGKGACHVIALVKHTVFFMKLFSIMLLIVHKAYQMVYPFDSQLLKKTDAIKTVSVFWFLSLTLNVIGIIGSENTAFSWKHLSCIAMQGKREWEGIVLITGLGLAVSIIITSLIVIVPIVR